MNFRQILACGVAAAALATGGAHAATINLVDEGGLIGSPGEKAFRMAAAYWGSVLTNNVTINIGASFAALPTNVIGSTNSNAQDFTVQAWENGFNATKSNSVIDQTLVLPTLNADGGVSLLTNGTTGGSTTTAINKQFYDDGTTKSSQLLFENTAVVKAVGGVLLDPTALDAHMQFSSDFAFDYDPTDGINAGTFDFLGVAIHEMGHALGFVSGVDYLDYFGAPKGPDRGNGDFNTTSIFTSLDMFRYSTDPNNKAPGSGPVLDETVGTAAYFSINGGLTPLFGSANFATGAYNGDGRQASHWKDTSGPNACTVQLGIMDPTFCFGQMGDVTSLDLAAFDALGWNLSVDALGGYNQNTGQIALRMGVPEPSTWILSIAGFGLMGATLRRRKTAAATA